MYTVNGTAKGGVVYALLKDSFAGKCGWCSGWSFARFILENSRKRFWNKSLYFAFECRLHSNSKGILPAGNC